MIVWHKPGSYAGISQEGRRGHALGRMRSCSLHESRQRQPYTLRCGRGSGAVDTAFRSILPGGTAYASRGSPTPLSSESRSSKRCQACSNVWTIPDALMVSAAQAVATFPGQRSWRTACIIGGNQRARASDSGRVVPPSRSCGKSGGDSGVQELACRADGRPLA